MIKITSLHKVYKTKRRNVCHALKNINLTLPDTGLVFVLGKSGSGKSTLLNLIGGLDSISRGKIEVDGNKLEKFREKDFCNYRNTHLGFIFQDYHLIDELTVYENIALSLDLRRIEDNDAVKAALKKVDLEGYEERYPSELSGGERQRVAIARAVVKNPRIILADEPTGNLDTHTSTAIISLLKSLSKECLILIVSHNVNDANTYADRIIELKGGEIISDKQRNPSFSDSVVLDGDTLIYPEGAKLSDEDISLINTRWGQNTKMVKRADKFVPQSKVKESGSAVKIGKETLSLKKELGLSGKFLKNKALYIAISSFMVSIIMVIMALAQTIIAFDSNQVLESEMKNANQDSMLFVKKLDDVDASRLGSSYITTIGDEDIETIYSSGYDGKIYPVINFSVPISRNNITQALGFSSLYSTVNLSESLGTMIVDEAFLKDRFGEIEYAVARDRFDPRGVIITDYVADLILAKNKLFKNKTYEDILRTGVYLSGNNVDTAIINAIIKTDYKERHKELYDRLTSGKLSMSAAIAKDIGASEMIDDVYNRLGYCYTTNQNFLEDINNSDSSIFANTYVLSVEKSTWSANAGAIKCVRNNGTKKLTNSWNTWRYTTTAPEIPEGARYMRVTHYPATEKYFQSEDKVYNVGYATLAFDGGEPVAKEVMNFKSNTSLTNRGNVYTNQSKRYLSDYIEIPEGAVITDFCASAVENLSFCTFYDENKCIISCVTASYYPDMPEKSVILSYDAYNSIFGTDFSASNVEQFVPHTVQLNQFMRYDIDQKNPLINERVTIIGLSTLNLASEDIYAKFQKNHYFEYALYFDGVNHISGTLEFLETGYKNQSAMIEGIHTMTEAVEVFIPIFELVAIFLCIGIVLILIIFASKMINDKMHDIGILKSLGTKNHSISTVFGLHILLVTALTCLMATVGYFFFIDLANDVLIESLKKFAPNRVVVDLQFLTFIPQIALENCVLVGVLSIASLVFPMVKIKAIKPVKIIKAKE